ncbi:AAA family ATPase [uncultured Microscilla sp.]|uniref:AAA family ATPase n=1 Tax=uncultured Microscilla sp. TaxID=432653 RepID=UPI00262BB0B3|nr:AAA family ATPase [uncultured Microscilla sp.]
MINKIEIQGYKSIRGLELNLRPINVLIGANGVGKSNFISFFKLVDNIYEQRLENYTMKQGAENLLCFGSKTTDRIISRIEFDTNNAYTIALQPTSSNSLFIESEWVEFCKTDKSWYQLSISYNEKEGSIKERGQGGGVPKYVSQYLKSFKLYHFHDTSENARLRTSAGLNDNLMLKEDGDNLPAFLYLLQEKHPKHFKRIEHTIKSIAPYFERFELQPDRLNEERINLEWREKSQPDFLLNARHFSDGTIRFIALATLLMQPNLPEVIIIDEPELGLHPVAITKLAGLIKKAAAKSQIIISTQSVNLVSNFSPEDIITVDKKDNQSVFNNLDSAMLDRWLDDYSLGDLWQKNMIDGQPF